MTGIREQLAKAVVLSSVQAATRQGRECKVVSFSSANNVVESGTISCDADGVMRLLDFLQSSFGGGTDVTGALKFVVSVDPGGHDRITKFIASLFDFSFFILLRLNH